LWAAAAVQAAGRDSPSNTSLCLDGKKNGLAGGSASEQMNGSNWPASQLLFHFDLRGVAASWPGCTAVGQQLHAHPTCSGIISSAPTIRNTAVRALSQSKPKDICFHCT